MIEPAHKMKMPMIFFLQNSKRGEPTLNYKGVHTDT